MNSVVSADIQKPGNVIEGGHDQNIGLFLLHDFAHTLQFGRAAFTGIFLF